MQPVFRILGPLDVIVKGNLSVPLGGQKQRTVLAMLLIELGRVVSVERITDGLWPEEPPKGSRNVIHVYVSTPRKALEPAADALGLASLNETKPPSYVLSEPSDSSDLALF